MLPEQTFRAGAGGGSALSPGPCRVNTPDTEITSDTPDTGKLGERVKCIGNGKKTTHQNVLTLTVCPHTPGDREHASHRWRAVIQRMESSVLLRLNICKHETVNGLVIWGK